MKSKLLALALAVSASFSAFATPVMSLPAGPLYLKFNGNEQIAINGATTSNYAGHEGEINWGVFTLNVIDQAFPETPHDSVQDGPVINIGHAQITGMFYGVKQGEASPGNVFPGTSGFIDLYWRDLDSPATPTQTFNNNTPDVRTAYDQATGYTQGTFLARLMFASGIDPNSSVNFISGTAVPIQGGPGAFHGTATSYANVDTSVTGAWSSQLNSDYFYVDGNPSITRDVRFNSNYDPKTAWNGADGNSNIVGARLDDPAQAFALPEPGALSLMGLALVGMGAIRRRKQK